MKFFLIMNNCIYKILLSDCSVIYNIETISINNRLTRCKSKSNYFL